MFIGTLKNAQRAFALHSKFETLFNFVLNNDFDKLPKGKVTVDGDDVFVMNNDIQGADQNAQPLEMHRQYIDVHILLNGSERIGWKPLEDINHYTQDYNADGDCALSDDVATMWVDLTPGQFCIVFPEDPHAPAISDGRIRKLIGKVKL